MFPILLSLAIILVILVVIEIIWRSGDISPEAGRKTIHILVGSFIAFWPLYMSWQTIQILSGLLFLGIVFSYIFGVFGAIHNVKRRTSGELWYPIGIGLCALLTKEPWVFSIAVLHMSLADGLAAVAGEKYGIRKYKIGNHTRSLIGSSVFLAVSFSLCIFAYVYLIGELPQKSIAVFVIVPFLATAVESISRHGLDNILVPLSIILALGLPTNALIFGFY